MKRLQRSKQEAPEFYFDGIDTSESSDRMAFFSFPEKEEEDEELYHGTPYVVDIRERRNPSISFHPISAKEKKETDQLDAEGEPRMSNAVSVHVENISPKINTRQERNTPPFFSRRSRVFSDGIIVPKKTRSISDQNLNRDVPEHCVETIEQNDSDFEIKESSIISEQPVSENISEEVPVVLEEQVVKFDEAVIPNNFENTHVAHSPEDLYGYTFQDSYILPEKETIPSLKENACKEIAADVPQSEDCGFQTIDCVESDSGEKEQTDISLEQYRNPRKGKKKHISIGSASWEKRESNSGSRLFRKSFSFLHDKETFFQWRNLKRFFVIPKPAYIFALFVGTLLFGVGTVSYVMYGISLQGLVLGVSNRGMQSASDAIGDLKNKEFSASSEKFEQAASSFQEASEEVSSWAGVLSNVTSAVPFFSKLSSGKNALEAGKHLSLAGKYMAQLVQIASEADISLKKEGSLLNIFRESIQLADQARTELAQAQENLNSVKISDLPSEKQEKFLTLKASLPDIVSGLTAVHTNTPAFLDVLGGNGPRKYLFLFQNNQEARATGGFVGSYGILDIKEGEIRKFFINGIFDPDGQLKENIVPPQPIRKISAAWSLHDSNWFADFPTSAEKAIFFYEKTGGPTVDGVITVTPTVLQRILQETGPVSLPEYNVTVNAENVISVLQYKVEKDYDKKENKPKQILSDLAPILFDRVFHAKDTNTVLGVVRALHTSLREKDILLYSRNESLENMYREMGWSGELRNTQRDFVSVVNSNINGFKTDGIVEQSVHHRAEIQEDGSVTDTVTITRKHTGGDTPYEWWNAVNADYMRVYVPKGSELVSARGQTRETIKDPLDYEALGFSQDKTVSEMEKSMKVDSDSGTQIFEESGKTVFGNWVYVSPKESVTVEYVYRLPFRVSLDDDPDMVLYSLLAQKQSGSVSGTFSFDMIYPKGWKMSWNSSSQKEDGDKSFATDLFFGYVLEK